MSLNVPSPPDRHHQEERTPAPTTTIQTLAFLPDCRYFRHLRRLRTTHTAGTALLPLTTTGGDPSARWAAGPGMHGQKPIGLHRQGGRRADGEALTLPVTVRHPYRAMCQAGAANPMVMMQQWTRGSAPRRDTARDTTNTTRGTDFRCQKLKVMLN